MVAPLPVGAVVMVGVRVRVVLLFESTPVTVCGDGAPPPVMVAAKSVVLRMIGWLNVMVRTPLAVIVPGSEFDAEVAKSELPITACLLYTSDAADE